MSDNDFPFGEPAPEDEAAGGRHIDRRLLIGGGVLAVALLAVGAKVFLLGGSDSASGGGVVAAAHPHTVKPTPTPAPTVGSSPAAVEPAPFSSCLGVCDPFSPLVVPPVSAPAATSAPVAAPAPTAPPSPAVVVVPGPTTTITVTATPGGPATAGPGQTVLTVSSVDVSKQLGSFTVNGTSFPNVPADNDPADLKSVFDKVFKLVAVFTDSQGQHCATVQYNDNTAPFSLCTGESRTVG